MDTRRDDVTNTLKWVELGQSLAVSFENIKFNLSESLRVTGEREGTGTAGKSLVPLGNYVKFSEIQKAGVVYKEQDDCAMFLSGSDTVIDTDAGIVKSSGTSESMRSGLVLSAGDVTITGTGEFNGLIMAKDAIKITGSVTLTADPDAYYPLLEDEDAAEYFYDYGDAPAAVIKRYEDFVIRENWRRSGLEPESGGGASDEEK